MTTYICQYHNNKACPIVSAFSFLIFHIHSRLSSNASLVFADRCEQQRTVMNTNKQLRKATNNHEYSRTATNLNSVAMFPNTCVPVSFSAKTPLVLVALIYLSGSVHIVIFVYHTLISFSYA